MIKYGEYRGLNVSIDDDGYFLAAIDESNIRERSYSDLKSKIDQALKNKQKAKKKPMAIKVVNEDLKTATVTGVHARLGRITMTPKLEHQRYGGSSNVWLDCEPARNLLTEKRAAEKRIEKINQELEVFQITTEHGFGEISNDDEYDRLVVVLEKRVASATKAAGKAVQRGA